MRDEDTQWEKQATHTRGNKWASVEVQWTAKGMSESASLAGFVRAVHLAGLHETCSRPERPPENPDCAFLETLHTTSNHHQAHHAIRAMHNPTPSLARRIFLNPSPMLLSISWLHQRYVKQGLAQLQYWDPHTQVKTPLPRTGDPRLVIGSLPHPWPVLAWQGGSPCTSLPGLPVLHNSRGKYIMDKGPASLVFIPIKLTKADTFDPQQSRCQT